MDRSCQQIISLVLISLLYHWFILMEYTCQGNAQVQLSDFGVRTESDCPHNYTQLLEELLTNYDKRLRPEYGGPPVDVKVGLYVENIFSVDESKMEISMTIYVRQLWRDSRLTFEGDSELVLKGDDIELFWSPDIFFLHEIRAWSHELTALNKALYIYPDGQIFKSQRLSLMTGCQMELHKFPLDKQKCSIEMLSYAYTSDHLLLEIPKDQIILDSEIIIPAFHLKAVSRYQSTRKLALGNYSCAGVTFNFHRYWQAYMLTVYLPSYLLVIISWLSFFIDSKSAPARVSLGVTTVLTMTTMSTSVLNSLPQVTYTKSIDIWLATCLVFIFAALVEYAVASQLNSHDERKQHKKTEQWRSSIFELSSSNGYRHDRFSNNKMGQRKHIREHSNSDLKFDLTLDLESADEAEPIPNGKDSDNAMSLMWLMPALKHGFSSRCTANHMDFHARWLYFILFSVFNVVYWVITF